MKSLIGLLIGFTAGIGSAWVYAWIMNPDVTSDVVWWIGIALSPLYTRFADMEIEKL